MTLTKAGPRNAKTDERNGIRTYTWQGKDYPSVTTLRRLVGTPFQLAVWQVEQAIKAAITHSSGLDSIVHQEGPEGAAKFLRKAATAERDRAANRGTDIHQAAADKINPATLPADIGLPLLQLQDFVARTGAVELLSERQVFNLKLGYGGSLDVLYEFPFNSPYEALRGRRIVTDYKSGSGLYVDHALQLIGYAMGEFVGNDDVRDDAATKLLHSANGVALLKLSNTDWELVEIEITPRLFSVFRAMCEFAHWQWENESIEPLVTRRIKST